MKKNILFLLLFSLSLQASIQNSIAIEKEVFANKLKDTSLLIECFEMAQDKETLFSCTEHPSLTDLSGEEFDRKKTFILNRKNNIVKLYKNTISCIENSKTLEDIDNCKYKSSKIEKRLFLGYENPQDLIDFKNKQRKLRREKLIKERKAHYEKNKINIQIEIAKTLQRIKTLNYEITKELEKLENLQKRL